jgi:hypothetical protein
MAMEMAALLLPECIPDCITEGVAKRADVQMAMLQQNEANPFGEFTGPASKVPNAVSAEKPWHCRKRRGSATAGMWLLLQCGCCSS